MSGSGAPGASGGGGYGAADTGTDCQRLRFNAMLQSPQPAVVGTLNPGDRLDVVLSAPEPGAPPSVEVRRADGAVAGALIERVRDLLRCLQQGAAFVALVRSIDGGAVRVTVQPR